MVLSLEELSAAEEDANDKMRLLIRLRRSTDSFIVQCLADREIQNLFHQHEKSHSKAYRYNCAVVHCPQAFYMVL